MAVERRTRGRRAGHLAPNEVQKKCGGPSERKVKGSRSPEMTEKETEATLGVLEENVQETIEAKIEELIKGKIKVEMEKLENKMEEKLQTITLDMREAKSNNKLAGEQDEKKGEQKDEKEKGGSKKEETDEAKKMAKETEYDVKGKKRTKASLLAEVRRLTKENSELKHEIEELRSAEKTREDEKRQPKQQSNVNEKNKEEDGGEPNGVSTASPGTSPISGRRGAVIDAADDGRWEVKGSKRIWKKKSEKEREGWTEAKGRIRGHISNEHEWQISTSNRFEVLDVEGEEKEAVRCLIVGDSRVRPLERVFCGGQDRCVSKPGATVAQLGPVIEEELTRCDPETIIVQVGVNDIGPRRSVQLLSDYGALLRQLQEARKPVIVTGILPRLSASNEWHSRALSANASVGKMCSAMGLKFVDRWEEFYGHGRYYLRDGLHLSDEGARALGEAYVSEIQGNATGGGVESQI